MSSLLAFPCFDDRVAGVEIETGSTLITALSYIFLVSSVLYNIVSVQKIGACSGFVVTWVKYATPEYCEEEIGLVNSN